MMSSCNLKLCMAISVFLFLLDFFFLPLCSSLRLRLQPVRWYVTFFLITFVLTVTAAVNVNLFRGFKSAESGHFLLLGLNRVMIYSWWNQLHHRWLTWIGLCSLFFFHFFQDLSFQCFFFFFVFLLLRPFWGWLLKGLMIFFFLLVGVLL